MPLLTRRTFLGAAVAAACAAAIPAFAAKPLTIGFSQVGAESEWRTANTASIKDAAKKAGVNLKFADAQQQQQNQVKAIRSFIAQRVDVIAFSPVVETGWETVLREAKNAKIPVILTDRAVKVSDPSLYVSFIGSDFVEEGRRAGRWLLDYAKKNGDKPLNIVELQGTVGSAPATDRKNGFAEVIAGNPKLKVLRSQTGDFTRAKGKEVMEAFLKSEGKDIVIVSIDGVRGAFEAMMQGKLNVTVECNPLLGPTLMQTAQSVVAGKPVAKRITVEEAVFPADVAAKVFPTRKY
jgi:simple sugar transport system substrate-binding protein